jgi:hypothetical protein
MTSLENATELDSILGFTEDFVQLKERFFVLGSCGGTRGII